MRRSKAWWAMLLPIERRTVWEMLRYGNDFGSGYNLPEGYTSCALCSTPCSGSTCRDCNQTFAKAEESADKAMEQGQLQLHAYGKILHIEPIDNNVFLWSPLQRQFSMLVGDVLVKVLCSPAILEPSCMSLGGSSRLLGTSPSPQATPSSPMRSRA